MGHGQPAGGSDAGQALEPSVQAEMQSRLGHDLKHVRLHTDAQAAARAQALNAAAYTVGPDVTFAAGQYSPHTPAGRELLGHELTHYVQQAGAARTTGRGGSPNGTAASRPAGERAAEIEADRNGARIAAGASAQVNVAAPVGAAKKDADDPDAHRFWFQSKAPEKPTTTSSGIEVTPKGQVVLDPSVRSVKTARGSFKVQFAGLDSDFQAGKPTAAFAGAENAVLAAITGAIADLGSLPDIKGAASMAAALAQRKNDETVRARLIETERTLSGKTLNIFIASDLSVAEKLSKAPIGFEHRADLRAGRRHRRSKEVVELALTSTKRACAVVDVVARSRPDSAAPD